MRKIITLLILLWAISGNAQLDTAVAKIARNEIQIFSHTLDSVSIKTQVTAMVGSFYLDTLNVDTNKDVIYHLVFSAKSLSGELGFGVKDIQIANINGVVNIVNTSEIISYRGQGTVGALKTSWTIVKVNNIIMVRVTTSSSNIIYFTLHKSTL